MTHDQWILLGLELLKGAVLLCGTLLAAAFFMMGISIMRLTPSQYKRLQAMSKTDHGWKTFWADLEAEREWLKRFR